MKIPLNANVCQGICGRRCSHWLRLQLALSQYDRAATEYVDAARLHRDHIDEIAASDQAASRHR